MMKITGNVLSAITIVVGVALMAGCATAPGYRVEDRRIVLDSPFVLEIGSTEYAKTFGDLLRSSAHANYDPETKTTTTNLDHYATARLVKPYFGFDQVSLYFEGPEKALTSCSLSIGDKLSSDKAAKTYEECRKAVDDIVKDVERRCGVVMHAGFHMTEEEAKKRVRELVEECKGDGPCGGCAVGLYGFYGDKNGRFAQESYCVDIMYDNHHRCSVNVNYHKDLTPLAHSYKPGDKIPVHTNKMSLSSGSLTDPTGEQKQAHEEAKKLRETIKRLFDVDLDKPEEKAELMSAAVLTNVEKDVKREWTSLAKPFAGMTERKVNASVSFFAIPFGVFALRCPYDGDVSEPELEDQAKRALEALEREYGAKIPELDTKEGTEMLVKRYGDGVPVFGDTKALLGLDKRSVFAGKVGDLAVDISYAAPRYAKNGDKYEIASKGAVVMNFVQSPFITKGKQKK